MLRNLGNGGPPSPCPEGTTWNGNACVCPTGKVLDPVTNTCVDKPFLSGSMVYILIGAVILFFMGRK